LNRLQYLLCKLAEESSEIAQIALKTQQFGLEERYPKDPKNNKERIHSELNDLNAIIELLNEEFSFGYKYDPYYIIEKEKKLNHYFEYSKQLGMIQ
jgi:hypothetical protein